MNESGRMERNNKKEIDTADNKSNDEEQALIIDHDLVSKQQSVKNAEFGVGAALKSAANAELAIVEANKSLTKLQSQMDINQIDQYIESSKTNQSESHLNSLFARLDKTRVDIDKARVDIEKAREYGDRAREDIANARAFFNIQRGVLDKVLPNETEMTLDHTINRHNQHYKEIIKVAASSDLNLEAGSYVFFPQECLGQTYLPHKFLFIRQEYVDVAAIIKAKLLKHRRVLVLGSPGIGKSLFGWFMFLHEARSHNDVAYKNGNERTFYCTWEEKSNKYKITSQPDNKKTYIGLFDGQESDDSLNLIIFSTSLLFASP